MAHKDKMNVLIDIGHPAHVHLFKHFIRYLKDKGHNVTVTSREKDITIPLLDHYKIEHICISKAEDGLIMKFVELVIRDIRTFYLHLRRKFDVSFGTSINITHLTALFGVPSYAFSESDDAVINFHATIAYPFATKIIIPECLNYSKWDEKRIKHNSSHKLAYLHPDHFVPNPEVLKKYDMEPKKFILVRKSALTAHHDINAKGITKSLWEQAEPLFEGYSIIDSKEGTVNKQIDFYDMHDLLNYAKLLICDSQSMAVEASLLGTPCIRVTTFKGKLSIIEELEHKYNLLFSYLPSEEEGILNKIKELLSDENIEEKFQERRQEMLRDKGDFTNWIIDLFENKIG